MKGAGQTEKAPLFSYFSTEDSTEEIPILHHPLKNSIPDWKWSFYNLPKIQFAIK